MNTVIDNLEDLPAQVKEKIFQMINQDLKQTPYYLLDEHTVVVKSISRCIIAVTNCRAIICAYNWRNFMPTL